MHRRIFTGSRALTALLLLLLPVIPACGGTPSAENEGQESTEALADATQTESTDQWTTVQAVRPEDILSEEERTGAPKYRDWNEESPDDQPIELPVGTSAGAIPAVKPFNFGRDPGGPEDKTLYLTVPKLGLEDVSAFDSISEEKLKESAIHVPATGFPWQDGANVYIAGHRLGYPDTDSLYVFYDLNKLAPGDEISLKDAAGDEYVYRVTEQKVVPPDNIEVMNAVEGESIVTLQTCTLPDFTERLVVQGELVEKSA
ncbi:MAG: sortase [Actinobacteria bacterium]|nr:sortase [Actinomycetota bacterium]